MSQVQCQIEIPETESSGKNLTVGQIFNLKCQGEWPELKRETLEIRLEEADKHKLKLLGFEPVSKTEVHLKVTSYKTGNHELKAIQLVDPENSVVLGDLKFTVQSVMDPKEPVAEPYGPYGPLGISLPAWYFVTLAVILALLLGYFGYKWKNRREKRKLLAEMRIHETSQDPYFQFYQTVRKLQRSYSAFSGQTPEPQETENFLQSLNEAYKVFLARNFEVPALKWPERKILSDLKRNHKIFYSEFRLEVRKALAELARALKSKSTMSGADCQQLLNLLRAHVDQVQNWLKGNRK